MNVDSPLTPDQEQLPVRMLNEYAYCPRLFHLMHVEGRWADKYAAEKQSVLTLEFKRFRQAFIELPCQIVKTGRRLVYRLLSWNRWLPVFFRGVRVLRQGSG